MHCTLDERMFTATATSLEEIAAFRNQYALALRAPQQGSTAGPAEAPATAATLVDGDLVVTGRVIATGFLLHCDARLKEDITSLAPNVVDKLSRLGSYMYKYKTELQAGDRLHIGLMAQEVAKEFPQAVHQDSDNLLAVDYAQLVPVVMQAARELDNKLVAHDQVLDNHENRLQVMESRPIKPAQLSFKKVLPLVPHFTGRVEELAAISAMLGPLNSGSRTGAVVCGVAGQGKTQLASKFAHDASEGGPYNVIWCLSGDQTQMLEDCVDLGRDCGAVAADAKSDDTAVGAVKRWLRNNGPWLLVFDNAEDRSTINKFIPDGTGHVVVTTRNTNSGDWPFRLLQLEHLSISEAHSLFETLCPIHFEPCKLEPLLVDDLQLHALGVSVSACFLRDSGCSLEWFRSQLPVARAREGEYPETLLVVVGLMLERLSPAARSIIDGCAFICPTNIPLDLFVSEGMDKCCCVMAMMELRRQALAMCSEELITVHQLIQLCVRELSDRDACVRQVGSLLELAFDRQCETELLRLRHRLLLSAHIMRLWNFVSIVKNLFLKTIQWFAFHKLNVAQVHVVAKALHDDAPQDLLLCHTLALSYGNLGRHAEGLVLDEQVLQLSRELLGDEHAEIATSMSNVAETYSALGRHAEALVLQEQVLHLRQKLFGDEHPNVALSMNNLAQRYAALGRHAEALVLQEQVLQLLQKLFGDEHPNVATSMNNLASTYSALGRYAEALVLQEQVLHLRQKLFGDEHPDVATSMNNLASTYSELGRYAEALVLQEQVLQRLQKLFGDEHPQRCTEHEQSGFDVLGAWPSCRGARSSRASAAAVSETVR
eukprot:TRINITY_DN7138_c0_g1_i17.p1 TRINITY_DN7138_c0_g1~~TRINITY_DN7138_c0_g1_i17.p1  ORF type:complete len:827 (-),score=170.27 TRINITY_DN7138_c0_g1_i17:1043-3523(-)